MNTVLKRPAGTDVKILAIQVRFSTRTMSNYVIYCRIFITSTKIKKKRLLLLAHAFY